MTTAEKIEIEQKSSGGTPPTAASPGNRRALGRGLDSLLGGRPRVVAPVEPTGKEPTGVVHEMPMQAHDDGVIQILLDEIDENPYQTRLHFSEGALKDLTDSIDANGLIQPIVVRPGADGRYILVLGERRCRASKLAGKTTIPAMVRTVSDQQAAEMTVVENLQREDLNCLEQANAFARLSREFGLTQEQIGHRTGVSRETVSNHMRLLKLPEPVQRHIAEGRIGFSEARVLLQLSHPEEIKLVAEQAVRKSLSVAALQQMVESMILPRVEHQQPREHQRADPNVRAAQSDLERALGVRVKISDRKGKGKIVIEYANLEDFDRVIGMLGAKAS